MQWKKPVQLSDGRVFESGTAAAKVLGVIKETVNKAIRNKWKVKGLGIERISLDAFHQSFPLTSLNQRIKVSAYENDYHGGRRHF
jgi:hypothetical protein